MKKINKLFYILAIVLVTALIFPTNVYAAPVEGGRTIFGESYTLNSGEILDGDLNVFGGVVDIQAGAVVTGNMFVLGGVVTVDGTIEGDLTAIGGTVSLGNNAVIEGDLTSPASYINQSQGATIEGDTIQGWNIPWTNVEIPEINTPQVFNTRSFRILPTVSSIARGIGTLLVLVALGALMLLVMPKPSEVMTDSLVAKPWHILGYGALTALVMLVGGIMLTLTICMIPIVVLVGLAFGLAMLTGWLALGYELGKRMASGIFKTSWHPVLAAVLGNLVLYLLARGLGLIPCLGGFLVFIASLFGLGMVIVTLFGTKPYPRVEGLGDDEPEVLNADEGPKPETDKKAAKK
jgi:hypothetical protein